MTQQIKLIRIERKHLSRFHKYLQYSLSQVEDAVRLVEFLKLKVGETPNLVRYFMRLHAHRTSTQKLILEP